MVVVEPCNRGNQSETRLGAGLYLRSWSCRIPVCRAVRAAFGVLGPLKDTCEDIFGNEGVDDRKSHTVIRQSRAYPIRIVVRVLASYYSYSQPNDGHPHW